MKNISSWLFRIAVLYLLAGVTLGIVMGGSHDFTMKPVHAHLNLLGWVTPALFAIFYKLWPSAADTTLARVHFWSYVPAHFVQMVTLAALYSGMPAIEPVLGVASVIVGLSIACFAVLVWRHAAVVPSQGTAAAPLSTAA